MTVSGRTAPDSYKPWSVARVRLPVNGSHMRSGRIGCCRARGWFPLAHSLLRAHHETSAISASRWDQPMHGCNEVLRCRDRAEDSSLHLDQFDRRPMVVFIRRSGAVLEQQALIAAIIGLTHRRMDADIGRNAG